MRMNLFCLKKCSAALFLIGKLTIANSLTLGNLQGAAILGRPLDVTATVQLAPGETSSDLCLDAVVTQGDTKEAGASARLMGESVQMPGQWRVRISTSGMLVEPVVTVDLRAGCKQTLTRQYVLLADLESEQLAAPLVSLETDRGKVVVANADVGVNKATETKSSSSPVAATPQSPVSKRIEVRKAPVTAQAPISSSVPASSRVAKVKRPAEVAVVKNTAPSQNNKAAPAAGAKLKLSASQVLAEKRPDLKLTPQLQQTPSDNSAVAAQAGAIWKAANLPIEDVASDVKRVAEFQSDIKTLRSQVESNEKLLLEMRTALQNAENGRVDVTWLYLLGVGFFASSLTGVFLWRRQQGVQKQILWQSEEKNESQFVPPSKPGVETTPVVSAASVDVKRQLVSQTIESAGATSADIDLDIYDSILSPKSQNEIAPQPASGVATDSPSAIMAPARAAVLPTPQRSSFMPSSHAGLRVATVEELFDIRQQAEFFVSLGQYDQAVQILRDCIGETEEARPIAYLDLMEIYHTLGRRRDFDACVADFSQIFSGRIPSFEDFKNTGDGIDKYPAYYSRIESEWATAATLETIESLIFVDPQNPSQSHLDLAAFNDLLLLHGIAKRVLGDDAGFLDTNRAALIKNPFAAATVASAAVMASGLETHSSYQTPALPDIEGASQLSMELPSLDALPSAIPTPVAPDQKKDVSDSNLIEFDFVLPDEK